jgi:hypothetical protein
MTTTTRPTFLTVLCILSYIGCGLSIISSLMQLATTPLAGVLNLVASLICLFGVIQMWKLKKMGFYLYLVGEIAPLIITFATLGFAAMFSFAGGFMALIAGLMSIFPILFIILYALNLKHLN